MSHVNNLFEMNKLNLCEAEFLQNKKIRSKKATNSTSVLEDNSICQSNVHRLIQYPKSCKQLMINSLAKICDTLPNNRDAPILIESSNFKLINNEPTSKCSNFANYKAMLDEQNRQKSKFFDVYYPTKRTDSNGNSLDNSQSSSSSTEIVDSAILITSNEDKKSTNSNDKSDEIKNFNLHTNPVQFNMDKVNYVRTLDKAESIIKNSISCSKVIALNCDSDCSLQNGIDLLEIAVMSKDMTLDHPDIFIFDIKEMPQIIDLFKPVFANNRIVKVLFDARFILRILARKYEVTQFTALFDAQLAYRLLLSKLTNRPIDQIKREKLLYVSWQCNGPSSNLEKLYLPKAYHFRNKAFWASRPINFEIMYNAAYDVFVMLPQLLTNLIVIMERSLDQQNQQLFIKLSNELIDRNLVSRKFAFFHTKHQYLGEVHRQIDLLIQSDISHRNKQISNWQNQFIDQTYYQPYLDDSEEGMFGSNLLKDQINDIDTDSYKSYSTNDDLMMNSVDNEDHEYGSGTHTEHSIFNHKQNEQSKICPQCQLIIKSDKLNELIDNLETENGLSELLFDDLKYCQCESLKSLDEELKCMNLLVDQIVDLAECRDDFMDLRD